MSKNPIKDFLSKFSFKPEMAGFVGVEREQYLVSLTSDTYTPQSKKFLDAIRNNLWTYELSACQVESRTNPRIDLSAIKIELLANENMGNKVARKLGLKLLNQEVANIDMPLDVYPDPRYLDIVRHISGEQLKAACRIAGIHIHIGTKDIHHAIAVNNLLTSHLDTFCNIGDHSNGERLRLYRAMAKDCQPTIYQCPEHFLEVAKKENFTDNPRNCWKLIRISIHGTVELRMFGSTDNTDEILEWVSLVKSATKEAM